MDQEDCEYLGLWYGGDDDGGVGRMVVSIMRVVLMMLDDGDDGSVSRECLVLPFMVLVFLYLYVNVFISSAQEEEVVYVVALPVRVEEDAAIKDQDTSELQEVKILHV